MLFRSPVGDLRRPSGTRGVLDVVDHALAPRCSWVADGLTLHLSRSLALVAIEQMRGVVRHEPALIKPPLPTAREGGAVGLGAGVASRNGSRCPVSRPLAPSRRRQKALERIRCGSTAWRRSGDAWEDLSVGSPQTLSEGERRIVAAWAADCAERVLGFFEAEAPRRGRLQWPHRGRGKASQRRNRWTCGA